MGFSTGPAQLSSEALPSQHDINICTMLQDAPQCGLFYWRPAFVLQRHKPIRGSGSPISWTPACCTRLLVFGVGGGGPGAFSAGGQGTGPNPRRQSICCIA